MPSKGKQSKKEEQDDANNANVGDETSNTRSAQSRKRKAARMKSLFDCDADSSLSEDDIDGYIRTKDTKDTDGEKDGEDDEEFSEVDEDDEALGFTFVGLSKKFLAEECPTSKSVRFVKEALKQALEDNELEEGASKIVMESVGKASMPKDVNPLKTGVTTNSSSCVHPAESSAKKATSAAAAQAQKKLAAEKVREAKAMKSWEEFMNHRIQRKLMSRIDELNEQNSAYKMLLQDERANDTRIVVTVELIKYLQWLKRKFGTHRNEFYCSRSKPDQKATSQAASKSKSSAKSSVESPSKTQRKKTVNGANQAVDEQPELPDCQSVSSSRSNCSSKSMSPGPSTSERSRRHKSPTPEKHNEGFKTPSPKKRPPVTSTAQSPLEDFYSMLQNFNESSSPQTGRARPSSHRSPKTNSEPDSILGISNNSPSPPKRANNQSTNAPTHPLTQSDALKQFEILNAELEELINAQKREMESGAPPDLQSLLDDVDVPELDFMQQIFGSPTKK